MVTQDVLNGLLLLFMAAVLNPSLALAGQSSAVLSDNSVVLVCRSHGVSVWRCRRAMPDAMPKAGGRRRCLEYLEENADADSVCPLLLHIRRNCLRKPPSALVI